MDANFKVTPLQSAVLNYFHHFPFHLEIPKNKYFILFNYVSINNAHLSIKEYNLQR